MARKVLIRSAEFLLSSLVRAFVVYLLLWVAVLTTAFFSLLTGWYSLNIESGLWGFSVHIDNEGPNHVTSIEGNMVGFFAIAVVVALLSRIGPATRALRSSIRSWAD